MNKLGALISGTIQSLYDWGRGGLLLFSLCGFYFWTTYSAIFLSYTLIHTLRFFLHLQNGLRSKPLLKMIWVTVMWQRCYNFVTVSDLGTVGIGRGQFWASGSVTGIQGHLRPWRQCHEQKPNRHDWSGKAGTGSPTRALWQATVQVWGWGGKWKSDQGPGIERPVWI